MRWLRRGNQDEVKVDLHFAELLDRHGLSAFERQLVLADIAGDRDWQLDTEKGVLSLLPDIELPAQLIGSVSKQSHTWLWAWANESIPEAVAHQASRLRSLGESEGFELFTTPQFDVRLVGDGHLLALVVVGILGADAYYRCPFGAGEAFVLVDLPDQPPAEARLNDAIHVVSTAGAAIPLAVTRAATASYLASKGFGVGQDERTITAKSGDSSASFQFDALGRLHDISAEIGQAPSN